MFDRSVLDRVLSHQQWFVTDAVIHMVSDLFVEYERKKNVIQELGAELARAVAANERSFQAFESIYADKISLFNELTVANKKIESLEKDLSNAKALHEQDLSHVEKLKDELGNYKQGLAMLNYQHNNLKYDNQVLTKDNEVLLAANAKLEENQKYYLRENDSLSLRRSHVEAERDAAVEIIDQIEELVSSVASIKSEGTSHD